ncbi:hypothetical protein ACIRSS_20295 [Amycolatopsis sp. NPDC101161]|uniref:hypothetical protein n=1 Tax=Amycolatopsis sp. NPDC101161 TaxID=3363940 RepID=UPI003802AAB7
MNRVRSAHFRFGDKVLLQRLGHDDWVPGRVVRVEESDSHPGDRYLRVKVATSVSSRGYLQGARLVPPGTPIYRSVGFGEIHLVRRDSRWEPFSVKPFMVPDDYRVMGGAPQFQMTGMPGATHVGAYQSATSYDPGDPVWAWECGWRKAEVQEAKPRWVTVRYLEGFRRQNGWPSKSCPPAEIWPVICDYPEPVRKIEIEPEWLRKLDPRNAHAMSLQLGYHNAGRYLKDCQQLGGCGIH